ncbi:TolC family outer membrane protein [Enterobacteriaceae bacterium C23F]
MLNFFNRAGCLAGILLPVCCHATDLEKSVAAAFQYDSSLQSREKTSEADKQKAWQGLAGLLPAVNLQGNWNKQRQPDASYDNGVTSHNYGVRVDQPVFDMSKMAGWYKGEAIADTADAQLRQAQEKLVTDVADAYFSVIHQQEVLQAARAAQQAFSQQLSKLQNGVANGQNTRTEVDEAQANVDIAAAKQIQAQNDLLQAGEAYRRLTGINPDTIEPVNPQCVIAPAARSLEEAMRQAGMQNVDVKIAQFETKQADADVMTANSAHLPVVSAYASYGKNWSRSKNNDNILYDAIFGNESKTDNFQYGVNVSVPLFAGGGQLSQSFEAAYRRQAAVYAVTDAQRKAMLDTRSAWLNIINGRALIKAQTQSVSSAKHKIQSVTYGREMGFRTTSDELDAQQHYFEALRDLSEARYHYLAALLSIEQLTGNLSLNVLKKFSCH